MANVQDLIDAASPGDTVRVPTGTYEVDVVNAPITPKSGITLDLTRVTLKALPTDKNHSCILNVYGVNDVSIIGGSFIGERDIHLVPVKPAGPEFGDDVYEGGWGHGIYIDGGSRNIKVQGSHVSRCFADGIYIQDGFKIEIDGVVSDGNRRQGLSVIQVDGLHVHDCTFSNTGQAPFGTIPGAGIDLECDLPAQYIKNVVIERCKFFGNRGSGIGVNGNPGTYSNIKIPAGNSFDMVTQPIWVAGGLNLGSHWWALALNRIFQPWYSDYRWWGYRTEWQV